MPDQIPGHHNVANEEHTGSHHTVDTNIQKKTLSMEPVYQSEKTPFDQIRFMAGNASMTSHQSWAFKSYSLDFS